MLKSSRWLCVCALLYSHPLEVSAAGLRPGRRRISVHPDLFIVLNSRGAYDRWAHAQRECSRYRIRCERFEAYDTHDWYHKTDRRAWNETKYNELVSHGVINRTWLSNGSALVPGAPVLLPTPQVVAVHLSHVHACAVAFMMNPSASWVVVLEDDFVFLRDPRVVEAQLGSRELDPLGRPAIVHMSSRAKWGYGREGYAISKRGCGLYLKYTLPLQRPGDLTLMSKLNRVRVPQVHSHVAYVKEDRHRFGSMKLYPLFVCNRTFSALSRAQLDNSSLFALRMRRYLRRHPAVPHAADPTDARRKSCVRPRQTFVADEFEQEQLLFARETHCIHSYDGGASLWLPRPDAPTGRTETCAKFAQREAARAEKAEEARSRAERRRRRHRDKDEEPDPDHFATEVRSEVRSEMRRAEIRSEMRRRARKRALGRGAADGTEERSMGARIFAELKESNEKSEKLLQAIWLGFEQMVQAVRGVRELKLKESPRSPRAQL